MKAYTEKECIESLFNAGGTLALEGVEILKHRKNAQAIYFTYKQKTYCFNKHNVILKFSDVENKRYFQIGCLDFDDQEYKEIVDCLKVKLSR